MMMVIAMMLMMMMMVVMNTNLSPAWMILVDTFFSFARC